MSKTYKLRWGTVRGRAGTLVTLSDEDAQNMGDLIELVEEVSAGPGGEVTDAGDAAGDDAGEDDEDSGDAESNTDELLASYYTGGSWYAFPVEGGEPVKIRGQQKALEYLQSVTLGQ